MTKFRFAQAQDRPKLKDVWKRSFGDTDELIDMFLDHFGVNSGIVGELSGEIVCAAYILPTEGLVLKDGTKRRCSYIYAISVLPEYRGNGLGKDITFAAVDFSYRLGNEFVVLSPSDEGLFEFYRSMGFGELTFANKFVFTREELKPSENNPKILPISPEKYCEIRRQNLQGRTHIELSGKAVGFQGKLGALYCLQHDGKEYCAAVEKSGSIATIKELLVPGDLLVPAVSALAAEIAASEYRVTVPVFDKNSAVRTGMIFPSEDFTADYPFLCLAYD